MNAWSPPPPEGLAQRLADLHGPRIALTDATGLHTSFSALADLAHGLSARLASQGVGPGDRVATLVSNRIEAVALLLACNHRGAVLVPLSWRLAPPEVAALIVDCAPKLLLADSIHAALTHGSSVRAMDFDAFAKGAAGDRDLAQRPAVVRGDDAGLILYTGGTTGLPKGAVLSWRAVLANARNTVRGWDLKPDDVTPLLFPLFHTGGWNVLTVPLLLLGGRTVVLGPFDAGLALATIVRERCTIVIGVPTMFHGMVTHRDFADLDLSNVRELVSGGAPCPQPIVDAFQSRGAAFRLGYGLTEAGPNNFRTSPEAARAKPQSVGRAMPGVELRIVAGGQPCPAGEPGELQLRGDHAFSGYWRRPDATRDAWTQDGWLRTGDVAVADADGDIAIVDRLKDMYISGGENVYPVEVEAALLTHPGVAMAAVIGVPDQKWGEVGKAFVVARPGVRLEPAQVLQHAKGLLGRFKVPRAVEVVDELPLSGAGKVLKAELRRREVPA